MKCIGALSHTHTAVKGRRDNRPREARLAIRRRKRKVYAAGCVQMRRESGDDGDIYDAVRSRRDCLESEAVCILGADDGMFAGK